MHFWVERFESLFRRFESLSPERSSVVRKCLSDSNPSSSDSNPFSSSQMVLKRFESLFRGFESLYNWPKIFKILHRRFESLFRGFESPCPLKRETLQLLKNPIAPFIFSKPFLSIFIPNCFKSVPNSKFLQNPLSYPFHIIILQFHHQKHTNQS